MQGLTKLGIGLLLGAGSTGCGAGVQPLEEGPAWFQMDDATPDNEDGDLVGYRLRAGRIGRESPIDIALPPESFAAGPVGDTLVIGHNDGALSRIELVDVVLGTRTVAVESAEVLRRAILDPSTGALYVFALEQATRAELGVFRFDAVLEGDGKPAALEDGELVLPPLAAEAVGEELFGPTFATSLDVTHDGRALVVQSCGEILCRTRVLDLDAGAITMRDELGQGELVFATADTLVVYEPGNGWPCKVLSVDVKTGDARELAFAYGANVAVDASGTSQLVYESGDEPGLLLARPLDRPLPGTDVNVEPRMLAVFGGAGDGDDEILHPVPRAQASLAALALPENLVAVGVDGRLGAPHGPPTPLVVRVDDGALFQTTHALAE